MHVRVYGMDTADFTVEGKDARGVFRLTDAWVKRGGGWQMMTLHSSRVK
jgi:hypothetical protein